MAKPISNLELKITIDSNGAALDTDGPDAAQELKRILNECIKRLGDDIQESDYATINDINGRPVCLLDLEVELEDIIDDRDEWVEHCKEFITEQGYTLHDGTVLKDWDLVADADYHGLNEWFKNYTDAAITDRQVVSEAFNWDWE